jgi:hypothetical protein
MKALYTDNVSSSLPRVAAARLVGHDGPVQVIRFTGMSVVASGGLVEEMRAWLTLQSRFSGQVSPLSVVVVVVVGVHLEYAAHCVIMPDDEK